MSASNVRNIESLEEFHAGLIRLAQRWEKSMQEMRMLIQRAEAHYTESWPAYWRHQTQLAQRELTASKEILSQKRSAARAADRVPATEAAQRVKKAEQRMRLCEQKQHEAKRWAFEMAQQCDEVFGPLADVVEHCEVLLPGAARELRTLIETLRTYAERSGGDVG